METGPQGAGKRRRGACVKAAYPVTNKQVSIYIILGYVYKNESVKRDNQGHKECDSVHCNFSRMEYMPY